MNAPVVTLNAAQQRIRSAALKLFAERGVTQISVSELAAATGVARGTIYNNVRDPEHLFEEIASQLGLEMNERVTRCYDHLDDPAQRLAGGARQFVRRAHEEPHWGRFMCRFAWSNATLQNLWSSQLWRDMTAGIESRRYGIGPEQMASAMAMIAGAVHSAMFLVIEGHKTWRDAGSEMVEFILVALGIARDEARQLATAPLSPLPEML